MYRVIKRGMDILLSALGLIALSPLFLLLILIVRLDSKGPAIFRQWRVGRGGGLFEIYKLRTMKTSAPPDVATAELEDAAAHITRVGHILRKTSLDELPQLLNMLRGDMSLIGPRPLVPGEKGIHEARMARGAYDVRPGITGWAQVNGRDCVDAETKAELDAYYAKHVSLYLDFKIMIFSFFIVLTARGVREGATAFDETIDERGALSKEPARRDEAV